MAAIPVYRRVCDLLGLLQRESIYLFGRLPRLDMIGPRHLATNGYSCIQLPAHVLIPEACRDYHLYPEDLLKPSGLSYNSLGCPEYLAGKYNYKMDQGLAFNSPPWACAQSLHSDTSYLDREDIGFITCEIMAPNKFR